MLQDILFIAVGLVGLFYGGDLLVSGAANLAKSFGIPPLVIGLTVVSFGTSAPELLVSLQAAFNGASDISVGNVVGSNIANIGLILGLTAIIFPLAVQEVLVKREIPIGIAVALLAVPLMINGDISRIDGAILVTGLIIFNIGLIWDSRRSVLKTGGNPDETIIGEIEALQTDKPVNRGTALLRFVAGLALLAGASNLTVTGAIGVAEALGVPQLVIGLTLVALGTSLPELSASLIAALRKQNDIAIGNIVGSNIFNLLGILGITALVRPITVSSQVIVRDLWVMIGFTVLLLPLVLNRRLSRREGILLLGLYIVYVIVAFILATPA